MKAQNSIVGPYGQYYLSRIIFNLLSLCMQLPFSDRWKMLEDEIIKPRYQERKNFEGGHKINPLYKYDMELFSVCGSKTSEYYPFPLICVANFYFLICDITRLGEKIFGCFPQLRGCFGILFQNFHMMLMA
jgi:hypothetical protein